MTGADPDELKRIAIELCANAFPTTPVAGVLTYVSRGTDDDAHGVLAGFGLNGEISSHAKRRRLGCGARDAAQGGPGAGAGEPNPHGAGGLVEL